MTGGTRRCKASAAAGWALAGFLVVSAVGVAADARITLPDDPLVGRLLFQNRNCVLCHGLAGSGTRIGPDLGEGRFSGTFLELGASLWNHVPGMSVTFETTGLPWPKLDAGEAADLLAFLYFIDYLGDPGRAEVGREIFESQGCGACHELEGGALGIGPDLGKIEKYVSPLFVAQQIWNHGPGMMQSMRELGMSAPTFEQGDLADLSAFLRQQSSEGPQERLFLAPGNPNSGRSLFVSKGCRGCHGEEGRGGAGGPDLTESDLHRSAEGIAATMWSHATGMRSAMERSGVGWPTFAGSEMADLIAYLYFLPFDDPPGDPARGASAFEQRSCATCHQSGHDDQAPPITGDTVASSDAFLAALWTHAPLMKDAILGQGLPWPELSGGDLRDLRAFLEERERIP